MLLVLVNSHNFDPSPVCGAGFVPSTAFHQLAEIFLETPPFRELGAF